MKQSDKLAELIEKGIQMASPLGTRGMPVLLLALIGQEGWSKSFAIISEALQRRKDPDDFIAEKIGIPVRIVRVVAELNRCGTTPKQLMLLLRNGALENADVVYFRRPRRCEHILN